MATRRTPIDPRTRRFGRMVRSLRRARGLTQEKLAELADLSADTIRRLEHGAFSPSLDTLFKLVTGLDLDLSGLFLAFDLPDQERERELVVMAQRLTAAELTVALRILSVLADLVRTIAGSNDGHGGEDA